MSLPAPILGPWQSRSGLGLGFLPDQRDAAAMSRGWVVVTAGPGYEPLDQVRRLTNFSTGELGLLLAGRLALAGWRVDCFLGEGATSRLDPKGIHLHRFSTNLDLKDRLLALPDRERVQAVFQVAALSDYRLDRVRDSTGRVRCEGKFPSLDGGLVLELKPAIKLLPRLREWFSSARVVGWKYEVTPGRQEVLAQGRRQLAEARTAACVVNGPGWGEGFCLLDPEDRQREFPDKGSLAEGLLEWLEAE